MDLSQIDFFAPLKNCWKIKPVKVTQTTLMGENIFEILDLSAPRFESRQVESQGQINRAIERAIFRPSAGGLAVGVGYFLLNVDDWQPIRPLLPLK